MDTDSRSSDAGNSFGCEKCRHLQDRPDVPHCIRTCESCGRIMQVHEPGAHGIGFVVKPGDHVVIPEGWFRFSFNPLKGSGHFTKGGLQWFAELLFVDQLITPEKRDDMETEISRLEKLCQDALRESPMLKGLDPDKDADSEKIFEILKDRKDTTEFWLLNEGFFLTAALQAIQNGTPGKVAWATACAERCRSMRIYKQHLEEVVWMGHSAGRLLDFLKLWDQHQANDDEVFWQIKMCLGLCKRSTIYLQKAGLVHDLIAKI